MPESFAHGVTLPDTVLDHELNVAARIRGHAALDFLARPVGGVPLGKDDLRIKTEDRRALDERLDVGELVATGNHDRTGDAASRGRLGHARDQEPRETESSERPDIRQHSIGEP